MGWAGHVAYMASEKINIIFWSKNLEGREGFENAGTAGTIMDKMDPKSVRF
jgi:hypothetical protein